MTAPIGFITFVSCMVVFIIAGVLKALGFSTKVAVLYGAVVACAVFAWGMTVTSGAPQ